MTHLVNKTLVTSGGITIFRPDIYSLDIVTDDNGNKELYILNNGEELIRFELNKESTEKLLSMLRM
ncbi:hypothetical protein GTGU_01242 [Trabulsiella guamensis ATCC 49490]|uniref:Uncharacterized protein n=2 Tax=Trabulsiella guamensis TaxID=158852 RepID=A0A085AF49_9ENTR|nr:hypothetical protein GTGU_01242 [Trabulsiella guamensis ATCC 49490]